MVKYLKAKNHKGITELKLMNLDQINVICGKNNSGKTSILEAIMMDNTRGIGKKVGDLVWFEKLFEPEAGKYSRPRPADSQAWFSGYMRNLIEQNTVWFSGEEAQILDGFCNDSATKMNTDRKTFSFSRMVQEFFDDLKKKFKPILIPPKRFLETEISIDLDQTVEPTGTGLLNRLFFLKNQGVESIFLKTYEKIYAAFYEITGHVFNIIPDQSNKITLFFKYKNGNWIRSNACGLGLSDVLVILSFTSDFDYSFILIEEPESHVHPDMQRRLMTFLRKAEEKQFILTTHSNVFLNNALVDRVFFATMKESVKVDDVTSRASILDDLGYSVADNLVSDLVVLVEGPTDAPVLEEYFVKMGIFERFNIKIWPMGGDIMDKVDLSVFAQNYKIIGLIDKDPKSVRIRNRFKNKCEANGIEVIQLKRYSIENYFSVRVLKEIFGPQIQEPFITIDPKKKLEEQIGIDVKRNNRKLAKEMAEEELKDTDDLYRFLLRVKELCENQ